MMKKSDINKALKENGYGFIKIQTGDWIKPEKCFTGFDGKKVKGIAGGSRGPMTATNAYEEKNVKVAEEAIYSLVKIGMKKEDGLLVSPDGKIKVSLTVNYFPTYARSAGYDDSYETAYIQPIFH
jgi:hypothetical protein